MHTPGPWKTVEVLDAKTNPCGYSVWQDKESQYLGEACGRKICQTPDGTTPENLANAKLMAAAPDMLEALKVCVIDFPGLTSFQHTTTRKIILAAITKATGENPYA